jgi:hypothetical protein
MRAAFTALLLLVGSTLYGAAPTDKRLALATIEKYTKSKTTPDSEQLYEIYANKYIKRAPEVTREGMQTVLEEIAESRPLLTGVTPQRFLDPRFFKELSDNDFIDGLYRGR